jgi:hypothetical protein
MKCILGSKLSVWAFASLTLTSAICQQFGVRSLDPVAVSSTLHSVGAVVLLFTLVALGLICFYQIVAYRTLYPFLGAVLMSAGGFDLLDLLYLNGDFLPTLHAHWTVFFFVAGTFILLDYENYKRLVRPM